MSGLDKPPQADPSGDPDRGDTDPGQNRIAIARATRLREAVSRAGGKNAVSQRSRIPLSTLGNYMRGRDLPSEALVAIADACGVSLEWLATGTGEARPGQTSAVPPPAPVQPPSTTGAAATQEALKPPVRPYRLDPAILAKVIEIVDVIIATSGRQYTPIERAGRIVNAYELMITPDEDLPALPQIVPR